MNKEERKTLCKDEFNNCEIVIENKQLQSQLETANKKLKDGIEFVNNIISETDGCDDCCESEKHLLASEMLSIIGGE